MAKSRADRRRDPFQLDNTEFAETLRKIAEKPLEEHPDEPEHPLRDDTLIAGIVQSLETFRRNLALTRGSGVRDDVYFKFNDGFLLRPEVVVKAVLEIIHKKWRDGPRTKR